MFANLRAAGLVVLLSLAGHAVVHGETEPGEVDPAVAARLTVAEVPTIVAAGASLGSLLRSRGRPQPGPGGDSGGAARRRSN